MAKIKNGHRYRRSRCPICFHSFSDVLKHLNHRNSKCSAWFETASPADNTSPYHRQEPEDTPLDTPPPDPEPFPTERPPSPTLPGPPKVDYTGAGLTYGKAPTFLDRFNQDKYASSRANNIYYPFSDKAEWELALFLLSSGLSMRKIDDFLMLKLVSHLIHSAQPEC
jgi:hypothetical protein